MCGRYRLSRRKQVIEEYFDASCDEDWAPRYNIAPTQPVPVVRQHSKQPRKLVTLMRWGLIPSWAKDASGAGMINARSETAATKPAFRDPLKFRRCLIPADGFYEWQRKQPFCFELINADMFAFAGLWDGWRNPGGEWIRSCTILTTTPNAVTSAVHDRMPVILGREHYEVWLDPGMTNQDEIAPLLRPYDARLMRCYPVSSRVNQATNDDPGCSSPAETADLQPRLF